MRTGLDMNLFVAMYGDPDAWTGVSASGMGATIACPARLALPQARATTVAAERGHALHAFARVVTKNPDGRAQALLDVPEEYRHTAEGMNLEAALEGLRVVGCERAWALNVQTRTVRYIGENIERSYNEELARQGKPLLTKYEIPFTIDVEAFWNDIPVELDYKSGQSIGDPLLHWQRRICAMGLMLAYDTPTAISRIAYIKEDGSIIPDGCEFSAMDIDEFCDEAVRGIDAVIEARLLFANGIMPAVNPSDEACQYCPAWASCPYWNNFAKSMLGRLKDIEKGPEVSALTPEEQGTLWADLKRAEKIIDHALKSLKMAAAKQPIPIDDKYEVRPIPRSKKYFDDAKARGLIVTLLSRLETPEKEIEKQLEKLYGKTEYEEYRKVKRHLPITSQPNNI